MPRRRREATEPVEREVWALRDVDFSVEAGEIVGVGPNAAGDPVPPDVGLTALCAGNRGVVLDFAGYKLVSSEFMGHLIRAHQAAWAAGSRLRVCCPDGSARQVLSEFKLDRVLPISVSRPSYVRSWRQSRRVHDRRRGLQA